MRRLLVICTCALLAACEPSAGSKFVGKWQSGCDADMCAVTTLNADHTFSVKFDHKDWTMSYSGTWRAEGDQLIEHVTKAENNLQDLIGKDFHILVSEFHGDRFKATVTEDGNTTSDFWKRSQ